MRLSPDNEAFTRIGYFLLRRKPAPPPVPEPPLPPDVTLDSEISVVPEERDYIKRIAQDNSSTRGLHTTAAVLHAHGGSATLGEIAEATGKRPGDVYQTVSRMSGVFTLANPRGEVSLKPKPLPAAR